MENITFYEQINLFLKNKRLRKPLACVHRLEPTYAGLLHANTSTDLRTKLRFQKPMKDKFSATNPTSFGSRSKPLFSHYIKPYMAPFQNTENPKGKPKIH